MEKQTVMAALRLDGQGVSIYGTVMNMSAKDITVRLNPGPVEADLFAVGAGVDLLVVARDRTYSAGTHILETSHGNLRLAFSAAVRVVQRRGTQRVPVDLDVSFRLIQDDGCYGSWKHGSSINISTGGMALLVETAIDSPHKMEVLFTLPEPPVEPVPGTTDENSLATLLGLDENMDAPITASTGRGVGPRTCAKVRPLKATARVTHRRRQADQSVVFGLAFRAISPGDRIRLTRFLNSPWLFGR